MMAFVQQWHSKLILFFLPSFWSRFVLRNSAKTHIPVSCPILKRRRGCEEPMWHLSPGSPGQCWGAGWWGGWGCTVASLTCCPATSLHSRSLWGHCSLITDHRCFLKLCFKLTLFNTIPHSLLGRTWDISLFSLSLFFQLIQYLKI